MPAAGRVDPAGNIEAKRADLPAEPSDMRTAHPRLLTLVGCVLLTAGCYEPPIDFLEVRRVDEPITADDIELLARVAEQMEGGRLPPLSPHFLPRPRWDAKRPATVATLAREELERLRESTRLPVLSDSIGRRPRLRYALEQEKLTREQYTSLLLAVGLATQRAKVDPARDLDRYVEVGRRILKQLADRDVSFAALSPDEQIRAVDEATWITRVNRAERLLEVPVANAALADRSDERLRRILPVAFLSDPLAAVADPLRDYGVPFRERPDSGFDSELTWSRADERAVGASR